MTAETIIPLIGSLGFPIVVAWYLLVKIVKTLEANTQALSELKGVIQRLMGTKEGV